MESTGHPSVSSALPGVDEALAGAAEAALAATRLWVDRVVIGLNLCPFAKAEQARNRIRYVCSLASDRQALLGAFGDEVRALSMAPAAEIETTLLVHPFVLRDFADYNDFLDLAEAALDEICGPGVLQVASFHPDYRFAGTAVDDITNATNRSPHPILQLLREASVESAVAAFPDSAAIYEANISTLRRLGPRGWAALQAECAAATPPPSAAGSTKG